VALTVALISDDDTCTAGASVVTCTVCVTGTDAQYQIIRLLRADIHRNAGFLFLY